MKLTNDSIQSLVKSQTINWTLATMLATAIALFAKLIWRGSFPILILLPIVLMSFAMASVSSIKRTLSKFAEPTES